MLRDNGKKVKQVFNYHITINEAKLILNHVKRHYATKYYIALLLLLTRGLRPSEMLAINVNDFTDDFKRLTFREAKTNKIRIKEFIIPCVAEQVKAYIMLNRYGLKDGFLFPFYSKKSAGLPHLTSEVFNAWFCKVRRKLGETHPEFNERYPFQQKTKIQYRYRVGVYSFRRLFETTLYINNKFNLALVKEIMEYSSKFDPMRHYIKFFHEDTAKEAILTQTFENMALNYIKGQSKLSEFV
jgi:integrase